MFQKLSHMSSENESSMPYLISAGALFASSLALSQRKSNLAMFFALSAVAAPSSYMLASMGSNKFLGLTGVSSNMAEAVASNTYATVYFDINIGGREAGRITMELYADTPKTSENFRALCTGEKGETEGSYFDKPKKLHYKGSPFHRIIPGFMAQGGDITRGDGRGGASIYGEKFRDENFLHRHSARPGTLSMANSGPNTNGSQFFLCFGGPFHHLDGKHTVFGRMVKGQDVLDQLERAGTQSG